uniref:Succinate dehydrogenase cytochrome b560 subunit, mitochondrial n=1 Tax=Schistocephalus solidus TaxID=70667 RepID=A0A183TFP9_SCHSO
LRANSAPFRGLAFRNLSLTSHSVPSTLLRCTPVLSTCKNGKGSTSEEVRNMAQSEMQAYWKTNVDLKRPWSPHLQIYHPPLCMQNSFLHRATGIAMAIVWASAGCAGFFYTGHFDAMLDYVNSYHLGPYVLGSCKFVLAYPLVYHYINGMRHLASMGLCYRFRYQNGEQNWNCRPHTFCSNHTRPRIDQTMSLAIPS